MKKAIVDHDRCVACGLCATKCPKNAITIFKGIVADVDEDLCVGCNLCGKACPANALLIERKSQIEK